MFFIAAIIITTVCLSCSRLGAWDIIAAGADTEGDGVSPDPTDPTDPTDPLLKRLSISLKPIAQGVDLVEFPVLVRLTAANFPYDSARSDGLDIRFKAADGSTSLSFERESWNPSGISDYWVKIPTLAATPADSIIWVYFGDDSSTDASNAGDVWTNGYLAILHGGYDDIALERYYRDSLGLNAPNTEGPFALPGDMAGSALFGTYGLQFSGANKVGIIFPVTPSLTDIGPLTFETWMRDQGTILNGALFFKGDNSVDKLSLSVQASSSIRFSIAYTATALTFDSDADIFASGSWTHLALSWNGGASVSMYSNGNSFISTSAGGDGDADSEWGRSADNRK